MMLDAFIEIMDVNQRDGFREKLRAARLAFDARVKPPASAVPVRRVLGGPMTPAEHREFDAAEAKRTAKSAAESAAPAGGAVLRRLGVSMADARKFGARQRPEAGAAAEDFDKATAPAGGAILRQLGVTAADVRRYARS